MFLYCNFQYDPSRNPNTIRFFFFLQCLPTSLIFFLFPLETLFLFYYTIKFLHFKWNHMKDCFHYILRSHLECYPVLSTARLRDTGTGAKKHNSDWGLEISLKKINEGKWAYLEKKMMAGDIIAFFKDFKTENEGLFSMVSVGKR